MLKRANFVSYNSEGQLRLIYCKMCGDEIAGTVTRPKGSGLGIEKLVERFIRFPNYAEIKMIFDSEPPSWHVTNGCKNCLNLNLNKSTLTELYLADCAEQGMPPGKRRPLRVVGVDLSARGLP